MRTEAPYCDSLRKKRREFYKLQEHVIARAWCKGCGICVEFCPKDVLGLDEEEKVLAVKPDNCICCKLCELRCPDLAIEVVTE
jgi:2-oxoglutarate ferredoxin oxidoreductase subunit delta